MGMELCKEERRERGTEESEGGREHRAEGGRQIR